MAATIGILFWGWLWGVMGQLLAVPLTAFIKLVADLHPSLMSLVQHARADAASDSTLDTLRRNCFGKSNSFLAPPSWKSSCSALTLSDRELRVIDSGASCILGAPVVFIRLQSAIGLRSERPNASSWSEQFCAAM